ncbi:MAG: hypothetical protein NUV91_03860, partial [Candidatus Omnitrophica bacterium]|nr:hypothetical protein [Candidatus Omnitrophota bacterium]
MAKQKIYQVRYHFNSKGTFVIDEYHQSKPFSNFFPGVAGIWGIPMWVFYVNRGQCVAGFGVESKDKAILEFHPANKAYRYTSLYGFRTFIKIRHANKWLFWEPFQDTTSGSSFAVQQRMEMSSYDLTIEEENLTLGLKISVNYFTIPNENFPALARRVTLTNTSKKKYAIEMIDGLPTINSYGVKDWFLKNMTRTIEAWMKVKGLKEKTPFFHLNVDAADTSEVRHIKEGNFFISFDPKRSSSPLLDPIVDVSLVFGNATDLIHPQAFWQQKAYQLSSRQETSNRTPCAMSLVKKTLAAGVSQEIVSLFGYAHSEKELKRIAQKVTNRKYIDEKARENQELIEEVKNYAFTHSASPEFDQYCGQTFLDNVLRGGLPVSLKTDAGKLALNVFSRKHGDLERDYNYFVLSPTYFSQGNGNYRDVNQNRRNDIWFNRDVGESGIVSFLSLSQVDGYNPLIVKGMSLSIDHSVQVDALIKELVDGHSPRLREKLLHGFQPGELLQLVLTEGIKLKVPIEDFLSKILSVCQKNEMADHGEGFWSDHWTYNLDLIESFLLRYPEKLRALLLEKYAFSFYHNRHYVLPRQERYILAPRGVRQYHSVKDGAKEIPSSKHHRLHTHAGTGDIYYTTLICKLLCLAANKVASLDPSGCGIEMEADKPNWCDSLNGLPGLLGSSTCETFELKRLALFLLHALNDASRDEEEVKIFEELYGFIEDLRTVLSSVSTPLEYWMQSNDVKERYRESVRRGITGVERKLTVGQIKEWVQLVLKKTDQAVEVAHDKKGLVVSYLYHEVTDYQVLEKKHGDQPYVMPKKFKRHDLPYFLEGFVHAMRIERNEDQARSLYRDLRQSPIFDRKLKMYRLNASLSSESEEVGRMCAFPPGWLENASIWLHMEYKYLLEILRSGIYEEFFETFKDVLIPFQKAERYGRSTLENSSFVVSSVHEDASLHGQGFVARLSGSTAEFIHIWLLMNVGKKPFIMDHENRLSLSLNPILPNWFFTKKAKTIRYLHQQKWQELELPAHTYAFKFLGSTLVVYHNAQRKNTFGKNAVTIKETVLTYTKHRE